MPINRPFEVADALQFKGFIDASTNPNYPAASAGYVYRISVGGKIGGAAGPDVDAGDTITCFVDDTASGDEATVGANWRVEGSVNDLTKSARQVTRSELGDRTHPINLNKKEGATAYVTDDKYPYIAIASGDVGDWLRIGGVHGSDNITPV